MIKIMYFAPAVLALLFYNMSGFTGSFGAIHPWAWFWTGILFIAAVIMSKKKWYGCIGGLAAGCLLIYMSTQATGQPIDIERPAGIIFCIYYLICGILVYRKSKKYS